MYSWVLSRIEVHDLQYLNPQFVFSGRKGGTAYFLRAITASCQSRLNMTEPVNGVLTSLHLYITCRFLPGIPLQKKQYGTIHKF